MDMNIHDNTSVYRLPGSGESKDNCGRWISPISCPDFGQPLLNGAKHDRFVTTCSCDSPDCPICYPSWAEKRARKATDRLIECATLYRVNGVRVPDFNHFILSPPQDEAIEAMKTVEGAKKLNAKAIEIFKEIGIMGGVYLDHPFRQNVPGETNYNPDIPNYSWYQSPHYHAVGCGWSKKSDDIYKKHGWVYKNVGRRQTIKGTIKYLLTHCGIRDNSHAFRYFGLFSYNKVAVDEVELMDEAIPCSGCGKFLHEYGFKTDDTGFEVLDDAGNPVPDWDLDQGVFYHTVKKRTYRILFRPVSKPLVVVKQEHISNQISLPGSIDERDQPLSREIRQRLEALERCVIVRSGKPARNKSNLVEVAC